MGLTHAFTSLALPLQMGIRLRRSSARRPLAAALITPGGHTRTKATYLSDVASKRLEYLAFEPTPSIAVWATPDLIVLRYMARIRLGVGVADEVELSAWHTDHYEKRDGKWTAVWSQATETRA